MLLITPLFQATDTLAQAQHQTFELHQTLNFIAENTCNGEFVAVTADRDLEIKLTLDANGRTHGHQHINLHGTGVGLTTGASYIIKQVSHASFNFVGASTEILTQSISVNGKGSTPGFNIHEVQKLTINANGEITAEVSHVRADCH
jgi:hypothetical protein